MEVVIFASVIGAGYFFNQKNKDSQVLTNTYTKGVDNVPNGLNIYQSDKVNEIKKDELIKADRLYTLAKSPSLTGVIPPYFNSLYSKLDEGDKNKILSEVDDSTLHAVDFQKYTSDKSSPILNNVFINPNSEQSSILNNIIKYKNPLPTKDILLQERPMFKSTAPVNKSNILTEESFGTLEQNSKINDMTGLPYDSSHNNAIPFFGSHIKETFKNENSVNTLEKFTGTESTYNSKIETNVNPLNGPDNIYGSTAFTATFGSDKSRFIPSMYRQNEKPIAEEYVSYTIGGSLKDTIRPQYKTIEDLVINPKVSYKGATGPGIYPTKRADVPSFSKHTPDVIYENAIDRSFVKSDVTKGIFDQDYTKNLKNPQRDNQSIDYQGNVGNSSLYNGKQGLIYCNDDNMYDENGLLKSCVKLPFKNEMTNNYKGNLSKIGNVNDFGKESIQLPNTHRISTNAERISSFNGSKAGALRVLDNLPITIKETLIQKDKIGNFKYDHNVNLSEATNRGINNITAKTTLKQDLGIITNRYTAQATKNVGLGYLTNKVKAKMTLKEILTNQSEYMGNPSSQDKKSQELRDQYDTVNFRDNREASLVRNNFSGPQRLNTVNDKESTFINKIRNADEKAHKDKEINRINLNIKKPNEINYHIGTVRNDRNKEVDISNRFGNGLHLEQLKNNPYNIYENIRE